MTALGLGLMFGAYVIGAFGYFLIRGYNVTVTEMFSSTWPSTKAASS